SRAATRRAYGQTLAQRNALIARIRSGRASSAALSSWDKQLAQYGIALMRDRRSALDAIAPSCPRIGAELGLDAELSLAYRPRSNAASAVQLAEELAERVAPDLERGFTGHGPHRDGPTLPL